MNEIRYDITTGTWVILASGRSQRPNHHDPNTDPKIKCPFCPKQESETPKEVFALRDRGKANAPGWQVRVFPNKFPALAHIIPEEIQASFNFSKPPPGLFPSVPAFGYHEVIVETPIHDLKIENMNASEIQLMIKAYRSRYQHLQKDENIKLIFVFRNYGIKAGASIPHPHSQVLASALLPKAAQNRYQHALKYFLKHERCIFQDIMQEEKKIDKRIILDTEHFIVMVPFAARTPFETWIMPKRHQHHFSQIEPDQIEDLAQVLKSVLTKLNAVLDNPHYNYIIYSAPHNHTLADQIKPAYRWHMKIYLRLSFFAGFEIGSGIAINSLAPEEAAKRLREVKV